MTSSRSSVLAGIVGAVLASGATAVLYECGVVGAGRAAPRDAASATGSAIAAPSAIAAVGASSPPPDDATRAQLLARDAEQRRQLESFADRLVTLERQLADARQPRAPGTPSGVGWAQETAADDPLAPSADALARWAKTCTLNYDYPPMHNPEPARIEEHTATSLGMSAGDVATANQILARQYTEWHARVRELYVEVVGPTPGLEDLSLLAMTIELENKGGGDQESAQLVRRLAQERAGQVAPPKDLSRASAYERYYRELVGLGNQTEARLAESIGAKLAHALRANLGGWGARVSTQGCADEMLSGGDGKIDSVSN